VLVGAGDMAPPEGARRFKGDVAVLSGGYPAFESGILSVAPAPADASPAVLADWRLRSALGAYFSGAKVQAPPPATRPVVAPVHDDAPAKKGGGC